MNCLMKDQKISTPLTSALHALAHAEGLVVITAMVETLRSGDAASMNRLASSLACADTSHRGKVVGNAEIAALLGPFVKGESITLKSTNVYLAGTPTRARASGYLAGNIIGGARPRDRRN
jgi:hypothetical protein